MINRIRRNEIYLANLGNTVGSEERGIRPVLIIHNETMNYSFEIEINDFANSWYIQVNDANCKYNVELGRRPNQYLSELKEPYVYISSSNPMDFPNDHILC